MSSRVRWMVDNQNVKLFFKEDASRQSVLLKGYIKVDLFSYRVEEIGAQPIQCHKCKRFGHVREICQEKLACASCGDEHDTKDCISTARSCVNCDETHSAFWRGCRIYKDAVLKKKKK